jgi:hypothetical protein
VFDIKQLLFVKAAKNNELNTRRKSLSNGFRLHQEWGKNCGETNLGHLAEARELLLGHVREVVQAEGGLGGGALEVVNPLEVLAEVAEASGLLVIRGINLAELGLVHFPLYRNKVLEAGKREIEAARAPKTATHHRSTQIFARWNHGSATYLLLIAARVLRGNAKGSREAQQAEDDRNSGELVHFRNLWIRLADC